MPDMATEAKIATIIAITALPVPKSIPEIPNRNATLTIALIAEPSMCIVAPSGRTISETSLEMPVSCAASIFVGIVATDEQVPNATAAGLNRCLHMTPAPPFPPPKRA